jgi:hypothetical protein
VLILIQVFLFVSFSVSSSKAEMKAAVWRVPVVADPSQSDDGVANAPALELQTYVDSSQYGDVKR